MNEPLKQDDSSNDGNSPPAQDVLMAEVRYGIVYGEMNEVFNGHMHRIFSFITILSGLLTGGSIVPLLGRVDQEIVVPWMLAFGVITALAFSAQKAFKFNEREAKFRKAKAAFQSLEGSGWNMSKADLQRRLAALRKDAPSEGAWLAPLAYNRACAELGHPDYQMPVSAPAKIVWSVTAWA